MGRKQMARSSRRMSHMYLAALVLETTLPWVSTTPLGFPVVPEV